MSSFPKAKRPASAKILDAWIRDRARAEGQVAERIRLGVGYMVVSAVLTRMRAVDGTPLFVLKGGVAMQLRFEHRARSSADIDMVFRRDLALLESTLAEAPRYPIGDFTVRAVGKPRMLGQTGAVRQPLQILYRRTPWSRIYLEVSPPEGGSAEIERLETGDAVRSAIRGAVSASFANGSLGIAGTLSVETRERDQRERWLADGTTTTSIAAAN